MLDQEQLICRIEGHGQLQLDLFCNQARLQIDEGERLFEQLVIGRDYQEAPFIAARICGVCPVAHSLAAIKALEAALNIRVNQLVVWLRKLMLAAQIIQSHLLHLVFLVLPDYSGQSSAADLVKNFPDQYHLVLNIKRVTDQLLEIVGGRIVHPITPTPGGFLKSLDKTRLLSLILDFEQVLDEAQDLIAQFSRLPYPSMNFEPLQLCLADQNSYSFWDGDIISNTNLNFNPRFYRQFIKEEVNYDSSAKIAKISQQGFSVGALARLNLMGKFLNPQAKKMLEGSGITLPLTNPFLNNFAQSVEVLHFLEEILKILYLLAKDENLWREEILTTIKNKTGEAAAAIEAPRGTLYYWFKVENGQVAECDIITPTVQNLTCIEQAANHLLVTNKNKTPQRKYKLVEMLIRAFDPCITCSVH
jgi:sulfhydrogenase subunit alpha